MKVNVKVHRGPARVSQSASGLEIYTQEPMERNKANIDVIRQIAGFYRVSPTSVRIVIGAKRRRKVVEVEL
ncbi:MAG: DUF167 family protein [Thermoplasmataceae archaeon]